MILNVAEVDPGALGNKADVDSDPIFGKKTSRFVVHVVIGIEVQLC